MKKHIILTGTAIAVVALCCAICGNTPAVDTVPAPAAESAVSAPCAPQTRPSGNSIITEPLTKPETAPVVGSAVSPAQNCPQETPTVIPAPTSAEEPATEQPATIPEPAPTEEPTAEPSVEEEPPAQTGMVYVPGFGYLQSEGPGEWSVNESIVRVGRK